MISLVGFLFFPMRFLALLFYVVLFLYSVNIRAVVFLKEKKKPTLCRNIHIVISSDNNLQHIKCNY